MSKKTDVVPSLIHRVPKRWPIPKPPIPGDTLVEKGVVLILARHMAQPAAEGSLTALKKVYEDWNEARVSQIQEIAAHIKPGGKGGKAGGKIALQAATSLKTYLQEVFQRTHGMTLSELIEDPAGATKHILQMPFLGIASGSYLLWLANEGKLPIHSGLVRVLDRIGLIRRAGSGKKGRELIEPLVPEGGGVDFLVAFGEVADRWCDSRRPLCHECPLVNDCVYGKKAYKDWQALQVRLEIQRKREEARRIEQEKKDAARREREEARAKKKAEADAKKKAREVDRKRRAHEHELAKMRRQSVKQAAAKKAAAKKVAAKKAAAKKAAAKKAAAKKAAAKKAAAKKAAAKKAAAKKAAAKKKTAKKITKKATKKVAKKAAKKATKKTTKKAAKKVTKKVTKKAPARRSTTSKAAKASKATKKKAAKKTTRKTSKKAASGGRRASRRR